MKKPFRPIDPLESIIEGEFFPSNLPFFEDVLGLFDSLEDESPEPNSVVLGVYKKGAKISAKLLWVTEAPLEFWDIKTKRRKKPPLRFFHIFPVGTGDNEGGK